MRFNRNYARYYDLLYKEKDYKSEAEYIHSLIQQYAPGMPAILELGCGTGKHAAFLATNGYTVHGVDLSEAMLSEAAARQQEMPDEVARRLSFSQGDIRKVRLGKTFDVIISLFHVISYQVTNEDLLSTFETAALHLNPGGVFIFDCWYGPAVLTDRPAVRVKRLEDEAIQVTRIAEPEIYPNKNCVDVNYGVMILDKETGKTEEFKELHQMRYLFTPEVLSLLNKNGMQMTSSFEWMSDRQPGFDTWGVCFVGRK